MRKILILTILLLGCEDIFDNPYVGREITYHIPKNENKSLERGINVKVGRTTKFRFRFRNIVIPKDSAIHKLYGFSDSFSPHLENSVREGWRFRADSTIDIFAYSRIDGHTYKKFLGNILPNVWYEAEVNIRKWGYNYKLSDIWYTRADRTDRWLLGFRYRLFPYYEDEFGNGAPTPVKIDIYEY